MNLATYANSEDLYVARGAEVSPNRPVFTGDVFQDVAVPGVQDRGTALVIAHPCSFRAGGGNLENRILVARVDRFSKQGPAAWRNGFYDRMPLPDLDGAGSWVGYLDEIGRALASDLPPDRRLACLSAFGINMLQQRLAFYLTRVDIPTATFNEAFSHTFEEAELLEDWTDSLSSSGWSQIRAATAFEAFIRKGEPCVQTKLLNPQLRSSVRRACREEATRLASSSS